MKLQLIREEHLGCQMRFRAVELQYSQLPGERVIYILLLQGYQIKSMGNGRAYQ
jgi:hypothetical protein